VFEKGLCNLGLVLMEGKGAMRGLSPPLLVSPVPQSTLLRDNGDRMGHRVLPSWLLILLYQSTPGEIHAAPLK